VDGVSGDVKVYQMSGESSRPLIAPTEPMPGNAISP
jgi:hypothetical protein